MEMCGTHLFYNAQASILTGTCLALYRQWLKLRYNA